MTDKACELGLEEEIGILRVFHWQPRAGMTGKASELNY
jgi:hypothetical protein